MNDQARERPPLDLAKSQALMDKGGGPRFWRSLDELAETDEFRRYLEDEFPERTPDWKEPAKRRSFLKVMGASLGLAGLTACTKALPEHIVPYVREPEDFVPGKPLFFATAMEMGGYATGLLVESHLGRPTKIEGNPDHSGSLGAADYFNQASILTLYDPDRSQTTTFNKAIASWVNFQAAVTSIRAAQGINGGSGLRILSETVLSPTMASQMDALKKAMPNMKWHQFEPAARVGSLGGAMLAFGKPVNTLYAFDKADVIVSLDADFLSCGPGNLRYARDFASRRQVRSNVAKEQPKQNRQEGYQAGPVAPLRNQAATHTEEDNSPSPYVAQVQPEGQPPDQITEKSQNRLYVVEAAPSNTGGMADHRWALQSGQILQFRHRRWYSGVQRYPGPRERSEGALGLEHRHRGRVSTARGPRPRARHECRVRQHRQDRDVYRPDRSRSGRSDAIASRPRGRHERGQGGSVVDLRRQPRLHRAGRRRL